MIGRPDPVPVTQNAPEERPDGDPLQAIAVGLTRSPAQIAPEVFQAGLLALRGYLRRRYTPGLAVEDIDDVAAEALTRLYESYTRGLLDEHSNPTGYLITVAARLAATRLAGTRREGTLQTGWENLLLTDDEAAAHLDQVATADTVQRAMRAAHNAGDATAVQVATYMLDALQRAGTLPSHRDAGLTLGISHTAVAKALTRLRRHIADAAPH